MLLIVGLGNPGMKYKSTYHNIGFMVVDSLSKKLNLKLKTNECKAKTCKSRHKGVDFVVAKPQTFMNLSGESVKQLIRKYDVYESDELVVVYDDVDLPVGKTRLRENGSAGTHNGMRNIIAELNTTDFKRIRIGIKTDELKNKEIQLIELVLSKIDYENKQVLNKCIDKASDAIIEIIEGKDIQRVEEKLNRKS